MLSIIALALVAALGVLLLLHFITRYKTKARNCYLNLPPGSLGWPFLGETLAYQKAGRDGAPEDFFKERMKKHDSSVFKTSLLGENMAVFCGPAGNKFLYSNENKLVMTWWPPSVQRLFGSSWITAPSEEASRVRRILMTFFNADGLVRCIRTMDVITQHHIKTHWEAKEEVKVYPISRIFAFELACRLFMGIEDPVQISKLAAQFNVFAKGVIEIPLNIPGTRFYGAKRAASAIRKELQPIVRERRAALAEKKVSPSQDLLSHLLVTADRNGRHLTEAEIIDNILTLLFAGHDTSSSVITVLMKYLGELPQVYEKVLSEQIDIASSKESGELLHWEDIQRMRYSWNVISEVLRLSPPVTGGFREARVDFTFAGYNIPQGWKIYWSANSIHKDPNFFPSEEKFDASRYEGAGPTPFSYVPFGGGPRMCLGREYARLEILVFLHYVVKGFKWDLVIPGEKIEFDPFPIPVKGLPISLRPHQRKP